MNKIYTLKLENKTEFINFLYKFQTAGFSQVLFEISDGFIKGFIYTQDKSFYKFVKLDLSKVTNEPVDKDSFLCAIYDLDNLIKILKSDLVKLSETKIDFEIYRDATSEIHNSHCCKLITIHCGKTSIKHKCGIISNFEYFSENKIWNLVDIESDISYKFSLPQSELVKIQKMTEIIDKYSDLCKFEVDNGQIVYSTDLISHPIENISNVEIHNEVSFSVERKMILNIDPVNQTFYISTGEIPACVCITDDKDSLTVFTEALYY